MFMRTTPAGIVTRPLEKVTDVGDIVATILLLAPAFHVPLCVDDWYVALVITEPTRTIPLDELIGKVDIGLPVPVTLATVILELEGSAPATNEYDTGAAVGAVQDIVAVFAVLETIVTAVGAAGAVVTESAAEGGELTISVDAVVAVPVYLYNCAVTVTLYVVEGDNPLRTTLAGVPNVLYDTIGVPVPDAGVAMTLFTR